MTSPITFDSFNFHPDIAAAISQAGYSTPTPIQQQAIPHVLEGRDVMGAAQTGTGKTAAFSLPILQCLMASANTSTSPARHPVRALMLAPTRELADQIYANVVQYSRLSPLRAAVVFGGMDMKPQMAELRKGVEVLVATPGRLLDHVEQKTVNLSQVQFLVLDEADRMLDMGFLPDLSRILNLLPSQRQSLMFSATFSPEIRKLANTMLRDPVTVEVAARNAAAETVEQKVFRLPTADDKRHAVGALFRERGFTQAIVFTNSKIGASRLARQLALDGFTADAIHGDKSQAERLKTLEAFKAAEVQLLVATDVAARGLDIAELPAVFNFDLPFSAEDYVHRIGRTGRAGASGVALSLMTGSDDKLLVEIEKLIKRPIPKGEIEITWGRADRGRSEESVRGERSPRRGAEPEAGWRRRGTEDGERESRGRRPAREETGSGGSRRRYDVPAGRPVVHDAIFSQPYVAKDEPAADPSDPAALAAGGAGLPGTARGGLARRPAKSLPFLLGGKKTS